MDISASKPETASPHRVLGPRAALVFATFLFGLSVRENSPAAGWAVALAIGLVTFLFIAKSAEPVPVEDSDPLEKRLFAAVVVFSVLGVAGWAPSTIGETSILLERLPGAVWGLLALAVFIGAERVVDRAPSFAIVSTVILVTMIAGVLHVVSVEGVGRDVYFLHSASAEAMAQGLNPYTEVVEIPDGSPTAEPGETITGYPYPPVTAIAYALGEWSLGDARYTSLMSWLLVLAVVGARAVVTRSRMALYVLLLLASIPGWPFVLRGAWTEPFSLLLLVLATVSWRRAASSGLSLGLALASKQYFVVATPLVLLHRDEGWARRIIVGLATVAITISAALVIDFQSFWSAAVEFHMVTPPRSDSSNLIGLLDVVGVTWFPPAILGLALGLTVAALVGMRSRSVGTFSLGLSLVLSVSFFVATQAFANYWFLITGLCSIALLLSLEDRSTRPS